MIVAYGGTAWTQITSRFLYGSTSAGTTGGSNNAIIPYHNHTFSGTAKNYTSGNQSANHTHTVNGGSHYHKIRPNGSWITVGSGQYAWGLANSSGATTESEGGHTHTVGNNNANHTHTTSITPEGTISYAGTNGNTTNANMPAYITCYIWRRTA